MVSTETKKRSFNWNGRAPCLTRHWWKTNARVYTNMYAKRKSPGKQGRNLTQA